MSEFSEGVTAPQETQAPTEEPVNYLNDMVGEGKQYGSVEEAAQGLAKKAVNADQFIETLKTEKQQLEEQYTELQTRNKSIDEIVEALRTPEPTPVETPTQQEPQSQLSVDEVMAELERRNQQKADEESRAKAIQGAWETLSSEEVFGDVEKAKIAVAQYIGEDKSRKTLVDNMALADPNGLAMILKQNQQSVQFTEPMSDRATEGFVPQNDRLTWEGVQKVRKENPRLYKSHAFKQRMHNELEL